MLHDADIREGLCLFLEEKYGRVRFFDELVIGRSRADIVMVTENAITGIEIKSDADSYTRLAGQVKDYDRYFDRNIVAVGTKHAMHIEEHVPDYWGIITIDEDIGEPDFYCLRHEADVQERKIRKQMELLWRRELLQIQEWNGLHKYSGKRRAFVEKYVMEQVEPELLARQIREVLFERDYTIFDNDGER